MTQYEIQVKISNVWKRYPKTKHFHSCAAAFTRLRHIRTKEKRPTIVRAFIVPNKTKLKIHKAAEREREAVNYEYL